MGLINGVEVDGCGGEVGDEVPRASVLVVRGGNLERGWSAKIKGMEPFQGTAFSVDVGGARIIVHDFPLEPHFRFLKPRGRG